MKELGKIIKDTLDNIIDGILFIDKDYKVVFVNKSALQLFGQKEEDILGQGCYELFRLAPVQPGGKASPFSCACTEVFKTGKSASAVFSYLMADGKVKTFDIVASPILSENDDVIQVLEVLRDVTEKKIAEEALRASEDMFKNLAEKSPNMIFINKKGRIVYVNNKCVEVMGYTKEELYSKDFDFITLTAPEFIDIIKENFRKHMEGREVPPYDYELLTKNGRKLTVILTSKLIDFEGERSILGIVTDVTERKQAEEALQKTEEEFRLTFENAKDAIFWADAETGLIIKCNKAAETLIEKKREEIVGSYPKTLHPPKKSKYYTDMFKEHIKKKGVVDVEAEVITKSGKIKPIHITASVTTIGEKQIIQGIFRDITARKKSDEDIRKALLNTQDEKAKSEAVIESIGDAVGIVDTDFKIIYQNHVSKEMFGDHIGEYCYKAYRQKEEICEGCPVYKTLKDGKVYTIDREVKYESGIKNLEITVSPLMDSSGKITGGIEVVRDVTNRRQAEKDIFSYGERLRILRDIDHAILTTRSIEKIAQVTLGSANEIMSSKCAVLSLYDDSDGLNIFISRAGQNKIEIKGPVLLKDFVISEKLKKGETLLVKDILEINEPNNFEKDLQTEGLRSYISIPLISLGILTGSLTVGKDVPDAFSSEDVTVAGEIADILAVAIQQIKSYEDLKRSEEKYRDLYDNAPDMYHSLDKDGIIIDCNKTWTKMLGYETEEIVGRHITDFFTERSRELFEKIFPDLVREKVVLNAEREFVRKDGTIFPAVLNIFAEIDENGELLRTRAITRDMTEIKHMQDSLTRTVFRLGILHRIGKALLSARPMKETVQNALEEIRQLASCLCAVVFLYDEKAGQREVYAFSADCRTKITEGVKLPLDDVDTVISLNCGEARVVGDISALSTRSELDKLMLADNMFSYIDIPIMYLDELIGTLCLVSDKPDAFSGEYIEIAQEIANLLGVVIERKHSDDVLKESERNYRDLVDHSLVGVYKTNLKGDIIYVNSALSDMLEFESSEELRESGVIARYKNIKDRDILIDKLRDTRTVDNFEVKLLTKTGKVKNVLLSARLDDGLISGMIMDITKQRSAEEATKASEMFLASVLESIQDGVVVLDKDYKILYTNKSYIQQTLSSLDDIRDKYCYEVSYDRDEPCFHDGIDCSVKEVFETGISRREIRKKSDKYMEMAVYPLKNISDEVISVVEIRRDVTSQVTLDEELKKRIRELEDFYEMAVGRELRMKQLKEEIEELKEESKKDRV